MIRPCGEKDYYYLGQIKVRNNTSFYTRYVRSGK